MTLFRKVFQNQARPASDEEALNEAALREAFSEQADGSESMINDPFEPREQGGLMHDAFEQVLDAKLADRVAKAEAQSEETDEENSEMPLRLTGAMPRRVRAPETVEAHVAVSQSGYQEDGDGHQAPEADGMYDPGYDTRHHAAEEYVDQPHAEADQVAEHDVQDDFAMPRECEQVDPPELLRTDTSADQPEAPEEEGAAETVAGLAAALDRFEAPGEQSMEEASEEETHMPAPVQENTDAETTSQEDCETDDLVAFAQAQLQAMNPAPEAPQAAPETDESEAIEGPEANEAFEAPEALDLSGGLDAVPAPAAGRAGRRSGRVKTRLLGFNRADAATEDPFGTNETTATQQREKFPVGWLVIVEGPGLGHSFSLFNGASVIGRGDDQVIKLDFGDNAISRQNHAAIAYDDEQNKFYIGHGGKSNIIRRNARPVLSTEELHHADLIRIGETTLRFVALCGSDFKWETTEDDDVARL